MGQAADNLMHSEKYLVRSALLVSAYKISADIRCCNTWHLCVWP